jgi:raffinose/stachyose/melibiose transport system substrate-binding protein
MGSGNRMTWRAVLPAAALLAACAPSTGSAGAGQTQPATAGTDAGQEVTLSVWSWRTEDKQAYEEIFDVYEADHPGVTIEFKPYVNTEYNTILATGLTEEGGPDVAQLRAYGGLQPLVEAGNLVPIEDEVAGLDGFSQEALDGARGLGDGKVYGVPFAIQTLQVFYNQQLFDQQGVSEPETWDEFVDVLDTFEQAGITPLATTGMDTWMLPILHDTIASTRYGGAEFQQAVQAGEATFTDPDYLASIGAVAELQEYLPDDVVGVSYTDAQTLFASGKAAMYPGGSFELGFFRSQAPELELGVFSVPPPPGSPVDTTLVPSWTDGSWGVNANSPNQQEALELVEWMATEEFGQLFVDKLGQISPVPGTESTDPVLTEMVDAWKQNPAPYLLLVDFRYGEPSGTDLMGEAMQSLLLGKSSPEQVAKNLWNGVSQWFEPKAE